MLGLAIPQILGANWSSYDTIIVHAPAAGKLKYLSGGQNKNKNLFWNKILF
jgi:hypothetical protein